MGHGEKSHLILELLERLLAAGGLGDLQGVEFHGLGEGTALAHSHHIADGDIPEESEKKKEDFKANIHEKYYQRLHSKRVLYQGHESNI